MKLIKIKVRPSSKKADVKRLSENHYEIHVKEKPVRGKATRAALLALADTLEIPSSRIRFVKGAKTPNKIVEIIDHG